MDADASHTVSLTVTVRGAGTNAGSGTSATARANRQAGVRDVLPAAAAPAVSIDAIPAGDEGGTVRLGATVDGGAYDGAAEYAWTVDGGTLDDPASATPTWTCPAVDADTDHTVRLTVTVTVRGSGTAARSGTSARANASRAVQVRNLVALPAAAAPTVTIDAIPAGDEDAAVQLGATVNGGTYDGAVEYAWTVDGGTLDDPASATPTWTRPTVTSNANYAVRLTVDRGWLRHEGRQRQPRHGEYEPVGLGAGRAATAPASHCTVGDDQRHPGGRRGNGRAAGRGAGRRHL